MVALDLKTRSVRWTIQYAILLAQAVIAGDKVFAADYDLIRTFDLKTGTASEVYMIPQHDGIIDQYLYQLNVTDDAVIAQAPSGDVFVFSRRTRERLWTFRGDYFLMNLADDTLYLLSRKELAALSLRTAAAIPRRMSTGTIGDAARRADDH